MRKNRKEYNTQLVKRGEIFIDPDILDTQSQLQQTKKSGRPFKYPRTLILLMLFFKYAFRLPYRQTEGFVKELFKKWAYLLKYQTSEHFTTDTAEKTLTFNTCHRTYKICHKI